MTPRIGTAARKQTGIPALVEGTEGTVSPPLLQGCVFSNFTDPDHYLLTGFHLILQLHIISPHDQAVADLVESLQVEPHRM